MSKDGQISADGLKFCCPIAELEEILQEKIRRAQDAGDKETIALYREVLALSRKKAKTLGLDPKEGSSQAATGRT